MNKTINDFTLFDLLPVGVIVFQDAKIEYVSQHILDVLNITYLNKKNAIEIIYKTIGLSSKDELLEFFSHHSYFTHGKKVIQIEHNKNGNLDIFSFVLIDKSVCEVDTKVLEPLKNNIDSKVADYFRLQNLTKIKVLTFFRGLPLKNFAKIVRITDKKIEILVDSKHILSLKEKDDIVLIVNEKKDTSIIEGKITNQDNNILTVENFSLSKESAHLRESVRIKTNDELVISIDDKKFQVYDISQKGISIFVKDEDEENFLKEQKSIKFFLNNELLPIDIEYLKTVYEDEKILKAIFNIFSITEVNSKISDYISKKQNEIIREIHECLKYIK